MTVSEMSTLLGSLLNDPNAEVFTATDYKLPALNSAQRELVLMLLGYANMDGGQRETVFDILSEIQEVETHSVDSSGFDLGSVTNRHFLRNGFVNASIVDDDDMTRWCTRITTAGMGKTENRYFEGTTRDPKVRIWGNKFYLLISVGGYSRDTTIYYVGMPYTLVASGAAGLGKNTTVTTCDLNPLLHDLIVLLAEVKCRRMRGTESDFAEAQLVSNFAMQQIQLLVQGAINEPQSKTLGQFMRNQMQYMEKKGK